MLMANRISLKMVFFILFYPFPLLLSAIEKSFPPSVGLSAHAHIELPYYSKFLLIAAYLASFNPARTDRRFFLKVYWSILIFLLSTHDHRILLNHDCTFMNYVITKKRFCLCYQSHGKIRKTNFLKKHEKVEKLLLLLIVHHCSSCRVY